MRYIRYGLALLCLLGLLLSAMAGCGQTAQNESKDEETSSHKGSSFAEDVGVESETQVKTVYRLHDTQVDWLTEQQIAAWREPLVALLSRMHARDFGEKSVGEDDTFYLERGYSVGLLDVNMDNTPEVIVDLGGGSAGNAFYYVYDLRSGDLLGSFNGGHNEEWCFYFDSESGECRLIGQYWWREGWDVRRRFVTELKTVDGERAIDEHTWMYSYHQIQAAPDEESAGEARGETYPKTTYAINGENVSLDEYYQVYDTFVMNCSRLAASGMKSVRWYGLNGYDSSPTPEQLASEMADALLSSGQAFICFS